VTGAPPAFGGVPLARFLDQLGSGEPYPGSGSAGAVALALAAGCALKAATISLKHAPDDPALAPARARFESLARCAVAGAEADADHFAKLIAALQLPRTDAGRHDAIAGEAAQTAAVGRWLIDLSAELERVLVEVEPRLHPSMAGDVTAARALLQANRAIQANNVQANEALS
jgi:formiminotetrahydrofolate cyclodeaminase